MTAEQRARAERMIDGHPEDGGGIRPAVMFADHSYPAFSRKQMIEFALAFAAETREECAVAARNALVDYEWPPQDGDAQCDAVLAAIRRGEGGGNG